MFSIFILYFIFSQAVVHGETHSAELSDKLIEEFGSGLWDGNVQRTKAILDEHPELLNASLEGEHGWTPLALAILNKRDELFSFLVFDKKADVNATSESTLRSLTPLHVTALYCRPEMAQVLIENEADIDVEATPLFTILILEETPLGVAVERNCLSVADILLENGANPSVRVGPSIRLGHTNLQRWPLKAKECLKNKKWERGVFDQCKYLTYSYVENNNLYNRNCRGLKSSERPYFKDTNLRWCGILFRSTENCIEELYKYLDIYINATSSLLQ